MFPVQRPAKWLFEAFGIVRGVNPQNLGGDIAPVVDVVQGGIGLGRWIEGVVTINPAGAGTTILIPRDETKTRLLLSLVCLNNSGVVIELQTRLQSLTNSHVQYRNGGLANGQRDTTSMSFAGRQWIVIPPGWEFNVYNDPIAAGTVNWQWLYNEMPAGTRPW